MLAKIKLLCRQYREVLLYLVFGVLTTAVNYLVFMVCTKIFTGSSTLPSNIIAWIVSVAFAYLTNRSWVFDSHAHSLADLLREAASFAGARLFSGLLDTGIMFLTVDILGYRWEIMKLLSNVLVVILNYLFSKFWIFRQKGEKENEIP